MDDNTRAKLGHSLDGELRRDSSDYLDTILIPISQATGAAGVSAPLTWTSDDSNMRTHMQLVLQRLSLSSDKTRTTDDSERRVRRRRKNLRIHAGGDGLPHQT